MQQVFHLPDAGMLATANDRSCKKDSHRTDPARVGDPTGENRKFVDCIPALDGVHFEFETDHLELFFCFGDETLSPAEPLAALVRLQVHY
jgi:hypothetical protein